MSPQSCTSSHSTAWLLGAGKRMLSTSKNDKTSLNLVVSNFEDLPKLWG